MKSRYLICCLTISLLLILCVGSYPQVATAGLETKTNVQINYLTNNADWYYESGQVGAELGYSVFMAGDVNGDDFADIIIGSPLYEVDGATEGAAFAFHGGAGGLQSLPNWWTSSGKQGSRFGSAVSTAGDVNGDGYDDVIVGAEEYKLSFDGNTGEPKSGAAFLYSGSEDGLANTPTWSQYAEAPEISFGFAVASAGDVNNDGYADVIIGAKNYESSPDQVNEGKVYLYLGSENGLSNTADWTYECNAAGSSCGYAVSSAGDVNGDGFDDIIIGAPHYDNPFTDEGAAMIFLGSAEGLNPHAHRILEIGQEDAWFGVSVAAAGDVNGDGYGDVLVGASNFDLSEDQIDYGAAYLYLGSSSGLNANYAWMATGAEAYAGFGRSVRSAGDINQDDHDDVLVGAYLFGQNGTIYQPDEGAVFLYMGNSYGLNSTSSWQAFGNKAETWFGFSAGSAGDINADGSMDIIVGAPKYRFDEKTVMGRSFVYLNILTTGNHSVFIPFIDK